MGLLIFLIRDASCRYNFGDVYVVLRYWGMNMFVFIGELWEVQPSSRACKNCKERMDLEVQ